MRIYTFWLLNTLLLKFNLHVNELGLFYKNSNNETSYLINTDINEALRFLKIDKSIIELLSMGTVGLLHNIITKSPYFNKAVFALMQRSDLDKEQLKDTRILSVLNYIKNNYDKIKSNYMYSRTPYLYDHLVFYTYGHKINNKITPKILRESEIKSKINTKILMDKFDIKEVKIAKNIYILFKKHIENKESNFFEQYVINNKQDIILKQFENFFKKEMVCAYLI